VTTFIEEQLDITLRIRVLVVTNDDGLLVFPEIHSGNAFLLVVSEILFDSAIEERVVLVADDDL
jgi:hypothetical protein